MAHDWQQLGTRLIEARVRLGHPKRAEFARQLGLDNDRTLADLEKGRRTNYLPSTLAQAEKWYGLAPGNIQELLNGELPRYLEPTVGGPGQAGRPALNILDEVKQGMTAEQVAELEARLVAEAWKARREIMGA